MKVKLIKLGEFRIDEVIPFLTKENTKREYQCDGIKYLVRMNSHRYFTFRDCMSCVSCGLLGTRMFLECHPSDRNPHFNLYGEENGNLMLMTKDHIHAKAFGGEDRHSNYQTMCYLCNSLKGHAKLTLEGVRELRIIHNENKNKVTKKRLHLLIEESKLRLQQSWDVDKLSCNQRKNQFAKNKSTADVVVTTCDINLYSAKNAEMYGKSVFDSVENKHKHVGCIKKGTCLEPVVSSKEKIMCQLFNDVVLLHHSLVKVKEKM
jgi:hypothetical protein